jgi:hypothetical protein
MKQLLSLIIKKKLLVIFLYFPLVLGFSRELPYVPPYEISYTLDLLFQDALKASTLPPSLSEGKVTKAFLKVKNKILVDPDILRARKIFKKEPHKDAYYFFLIKLYLNFIQNHLEKAPESKSLVFIELQKILKLCVFKIDIILKAFADESHFEDDFS